MCAVFLVIKKETLAIREASFMDGVDSPVLLWASVVSDSKTGRQRAAARFLGRERAWIAFLFVSRQATADLRSPPLCRE